ncbi:MAG: flagellar protein FliT [Dechloromonas agitata]|uniref:Flagellar protein FliT n=1 Tax=Dechloromonas agitata TaxID=73030 RepID=A0A930FYQ0_9RHOO|nr:flagellar protein FliT [Dechloromonas agitata]
MTPLALAREAACLSEEMVKLAHAQAWETLAETERRRAAVLARLSLDGLSDSATPEFVDLLKQIQRCDSDVRSHVEPWMASVKTLLAGLQSSTKPK